MTDVERMLRDNLRLTYTESFATRCSVSRLSEIDNHFRLIEIALTHFHPPITGGEKWDNRRRIKA